MPVQGENKNMKKVATGRQIAVIVRRALAKKIQEIPEVTVWLACIEQALAEADAPRRHLHSPARNFLSSDSFVLICDAIGLDSDWVKELLRDHAGWMRAA